MKCLMQLMFCALMVSLTHLFMPQRSIQLFSHPHNNGILLNSDAGKDEISVRSMIILECFSAKVFFGTKDVKSPAQS